MADHLVPKELLRSQAQRILAAAKEGWDEWECRRATALLLEAGRAMRNAFPHSETLAVFEEAHRLASQTGVRAAQAEALYYQGVIHTEAGAYDPARQALADARAIFDEIGDRAGEAATLHGLATIDAQQDDYDAARAGFHRALDIRQQIGDRAGEAATLHGLATIDAQQDDYDAARAGFHRALDIRQAIADRAGEAATWHQLGFLAAAQGRRAEGARLVALCFLIDQSIGHGDAEKTFAALVGLASELQYTQEQFAAMLREVAEAYARERGQGLLRAAFPDGEPPPA